MKQIFWAKILLPTCYLFFSIKGFSFVDRFVMTPNKDSFNQCENAKEWNFQTTTLKSLRFYKKVIKKAKGNLIFFHGSGRSACSNFEIMPYLQNLPLNIFIVEYPGYGGDKKRPSEKRILPASLAMYDHVKMTNTLPIILYGSSMGTTIATYVASQREDALGLILRNPPTSIEDVVVASSFKFVSWFLRSKFKSYDWAKKVKAPVRVFHGSEDDWIPVEMGKRQSKNFIASPSIVFCSFSYQSLPEKLWKGIPDFEDKKTSGRASQHQALFHYPEYQQEVKFFITNLLKGEEGPKFFHQGQKDNLQCEEVIRP